MSLNAVGQFPVYRPRRLRQSAALRRLVCETHLDAAQLVLPLFVRKGSRLRRPIHAMPGVFQLSQDELLRDAARAFALGVPAVLLFGIPDRKDAKASGAYAANGVVQQAVRLLKKELPQLLVVTDVCLCEYMEHGHCGLVRRDKSGAKILNSRRRWPVDPVELGERLGRKIWNKSSFKHRLMRNSLQDRPVLPVVCVRHVRGLF